MRANEKKGMLFIDPNTKEWKVVNSDAYLIYGTNDGSIYYDRSHGPQTSSFGYYNMKSKSSINHRANVINEYYEKGSEILPSNNQEKAYDLIEVEVYKIIIE